MNRIETEIFNKVIDELDTDLENRFVNIQITDSDVSGITVLVGFDYNTQFADSDVSVIRHSYFDAEEDWRNVWEIPNVSDFKKYINDKNLVDRWNQQILENEAVDLKDEVREYVKDFLNDGYVFNVVETVAEELEDEEESVDVDELVETLQGININVKYDNDNFWTEDDLIEQWEYEVSGI